jgi:solute carrier family 39 (zinc transporter), member 1/2/3
MTPFVLMIALSTHAMFEGLAMGLTPDLKTVETIAAAILIHKGAAASSLGIALVKTFPDNFKLCRWLLFVFACASPLGVILGIALGSQGEIYEIVFSSLAAGSFVYIACSEVIVEEFTIPGNRGLKLLAFLIGITIITSLWLLD